MQSRFITKDGETIIIFSKSSEAQKFSAFDPAGATWGVAQGYRVVSDPLKPIFTLVPLGEPQRITTADVNRHPEIEEALK
jgi:hypothetical protein